MITITGTLVPPAGSPRSLRVDFIPRAVRIEGGALVLLDRTTMHTDADGVFAGTLAAGAYIVRVHLEPVHTIFGITITEDASGTVNITTLVDAMEDESLPVSGTPGKLDYSRPGNPL